MREKNKYEVLKILLENKDRYISGEQISNMLGITRASVWKDIDFFRREGYVIQSKFKEGYRLINSADRLFPPEIQQELRTSVFGKNILYYDTVQSTNQVLKNLAVQGYDEGTVVIAEKQTSGRGRLDRKWISPSYKGIWMSILLKPSLSSAHVTRITLITAVCVADAIENHIDRQVQIKWPNDIIIEGKKVCGILTELKGEVDRVNYIIVGMGINVNADMDDFPQEVGHKATSLKYFTEGKIIRKALVSDILQNLEKYYSMYIDDNDFNKILGIYKEKSAVLGKRVRVLSLSDDFSGKVIDFNNDGALLVLKDDNETEVVFSGEVSIRGIDSYI